MPKPKTSAPIRDGLHAAAGGVDPSVQRQVLKKAIQEGKTQKVTLRLPVELVLNIHEIAQQEAGHKKAFNQAIVVMLEKAVEDYRAGRLKFSQAPLVVKSRLVRGG